MGKNSVHNAVAVRAAYERALELYQMVVPKKAQQYLGAMANEQAYRSVKDGGHLSGMPAKLWKDIMMGKPVDDVMLYMFDDVNAGKPKAKKVEMVRVRRSLDEDYTPKKKQVKKQKKGRR
jgi:hypothetical protein